MSDAPMAAAATVSGTARSGVVDATRLGHLVIAHGMLVLGIGLLPGLGLVFSLLDAVELWPLPAWEVSLPGSTRGWQAAHVGGITNGIMIAVVALLMRHLDMQGRAAAWTGWGMIATGWGNTLFYWAGNLSQNRGLSVGATPYGAGDLAGALAYLGGGGAMVFTFLATALVGQAAWRRYREGSGAG